MNDERRTGAVRPLLCLLALLALAGCDLSEDDFEPEVVVEAFLVAGEPLPTIRLSTTAPIGEPYSFDAYALTGAEVDVHLLGEGGAAAETFGFYENVDVPGNEGSFPGNYAPAETHRVLPGRRYRLTVRVPERPDLVPPGELVRAETAVPDTFRIVNPPPDTIRYDILRPSPAIDVTRSLNPDRQGIYVFNIEALAPDDYGLTPTIAALIGDSDEVGPEDFVQTSSPILNEGNYELNPDGTLRLRVPWFAIAFYGPNLLSANALDDALFDFLRSRNAQFNPTTLSPGEIQRVLSNVENGTGVFGSLARVQTQAFVAE
jgi:hypothetical protein